MNGFNQTDDPDNPIKRFLFLQLIQPSHCVSRRSSCQKVLLSLDAHFLVDLGFVSPCCLLTFQRMTYKQEGTEDRVGELPMFPCSAAFVMLAASVMVIADCLPSAPFQWSSIVGGLGANSSLPPQ